MRVAHVIALRLALAGGLLALAPSSLGEVFLAVYATVQHGGRGMWDVGCGVWGVGYVRCVNTLHNTRR